MICRTLEDHSIQSEKHLCQKIEQQHRKHKKAACKYFQKEFCFFFTRVSKILCRSQQVRQNHSHRRNVTSKQQVTINRSYIVNTKITTLHEMRDTWHEVLKVKPTIQNQHWLKKYFELFELWSEYPFVVILLFSCKKN